MNIRQLQYVREIARNGLSISKAAKLLNTSQPGVSQQVIALERELGVDIFTRDRNRLTGITERGQGVLEHAEAALFNVDCVYSVCRAGERHARQKLVIATSHTQARYVLPPALRRFAEAHPGTQLVVQHDAQNRMLDLVMEGEVDIAVTTATAARHRDEVIMMPCNESQRVVVVPPGHPLLDEERLSFAALARYDLITYHESIPTRQMLLETFARNGAVPRVRLSAIDSDVIKAYVAEGLGISILPEMTVHPASNPDLRVIRNPILFPPSITSLMVNRRKVISRVTIDFIKLFCPGVSLPPGVMVAR